MFQLGLDLCTGSLSGRNDRVLFRSLSTGPGNGVNDDFVHLLNQGHEVATQNLAQALPRN